MQIATRGKHTLPCFYYKASFFDTKVIRLNTNFIVFNAKSIVLIRTSVSACTVTSEQSTDDSHVTVPKVMNYVFEMVNFALKMVDFVFKKHEFCNYNSGFCI